MTRFTYALVGATMSLHIAVAQYSNQNGVRSVVVDEIVAHGAYASTPDPTCMAQTNFNDVISVAAKIVSSSTSGVGYWGPVLAVIDKFHDDLRAATQLGGWLNEVV